MANAKTNANELHSILTGGTNEKPESVIAESVRIVKPVDIKHAGNVMGEVPFNLLAGMVDPAFLEKGGLDCFPRSLKNDKAAFKFLLDQSAAHIRMAWEQAQKSRKRYTAPTLQALQKAVKALDKPEDGEMKKSVAEQVADILKGKGTTKAKLDAIAELEQVAKFLADGEAS